MSSRLYGAPHCRWSKGLDSSERTSSVRSGLSGSDRSSSGDGIPSRAQGIKLERSTSLLSRNLASKAVSLSQHTSLESSLLKPGPLLRMSHSSVNVG